MEYKVGNYTFTDEATAAKAGKEAETIAFIRNRSDLSKPENITKIIHTITDNRMFETPVGLDFLEELQKLEKSGKTLAEKAPAVSSPVVSKETSSNDFGTSSDDSTASADEDYIRAEVIRRTKHLKESAEERVEKIRETYVDKARNLRIVIFTLVGIIIALLVLTFFSDSSPLMDAEEKVINKYSTWEVELKQKEERLKTWENELKELEKKLNSDNK